MTTTAPAVIGKCAAGHVTKGSAEDVRGGWIQCPCGRSAVAKWMTVTYKAERVCNGVCMGASGASCSCSCNGANHGSGKAFAGSRLD